MFAFGVCLLDTDRGIQVFLPLEFVCFILRYPGPVCLFGIVCGTLKCTLNTAVFTGCLLLLDSLWYDEFVYFILRCPLFAFHGFIEVRRDCLFHTEVSRLFGGLFFGLFVVRRNVHLIQGYPGFVCFSWTLCGTSSSILLNTEVSPGFVFLKYWRLAFLGLIVVTQVCLLHTEVLSV